MRRSARELISGGSAASKSYTAIWLKLSCAESPVPSSDDAAAAVRASGGVADDQLVGDVGAAAAYLRALSNSNQLVGVIGYCSGGRQSVLAACSLDLDAAVDCYGAFVVMSRPESTMTSIVDLLPNLSCS